MTVEAQGRVAVVTGASRGLGAATARVLSAAGVRVAGCARGARPGEELGERTWYQGGCDVRDFESLSSFARAAADRLGPLDLWVNNAGIVEPVGMTRELDAEAVRRHIEVNLLGVFNGARIFLAMLREERRAGTLVNITSGAATHPYAGWGPYCASKAAVDQLTRVLAEEEQASGVRVFALAPGVVDTSMQQRVRELDPSRFPGVERFRTLKQQNRLARPEEAAEVVLRLAFDPELRPEEVILDVRELR